MEGQSLRKSPCFPETNIVHLFDAKFFNCYVLQLPMAKLPDFIIVGVSLVLHLDNFFMDHVLYFDKTNPRTRMGGIELGLHHPGTYPVAGFDGYLLSPGYFTDFKLKFVSRKRLREPYGNCNGDPLGNASYTMDYCVASCIQHHITEACDCIDFSINLGMGEYDHFSNFTNCFNLRHGRDNLLKKWDCLLRERYHSTASCASHCSLPCRETAYSTKVNTFSSWWRHQMETLSALLALGAGNSPVTREFPSQRPVARSFDVFFDLRLNKRLSKQSWGWWFETPSRSLRRQWNVSNRPWISLWMNRVYRLDITFQVLTGPIKLILIISDVTTEHKTSETSMKIMFWLLFIGSLCHLNDNVRTVVKTFLCTHFSVILKYNPRVDSQIGKSTSK